MRRTLVLSLLSLLLCSALGHPLPKRDKATSSDTRSNQVAKTVASRSTPGQPFNKVHFELNRGQLDSRIRYAARLENYTVGILDDGVIIAVRAGSHEQSAAPHQTLRTLLKPAGVEWTPETRMIESVSIRLHGASYRSAPLGQDPSAGRSHYLIGSHPTEWITGVPRYESVRVDGAYEGIDVVYYMSGENLEYDFVVAPGADPSDIALDVAGAESLEIDSDGDAVIRTPSGLVLRHKAPRIYQDAEGGVRDRVDGGYRLLAGNRLGLEIGSYDRERELVIDPVLFSAYFGGSSDERAFGIDVDAQGNIYVSGYTDSIDFPTVSALSNSTGGGRDAFVVKLDPTGENVLYATYLGGSGEDQGLRIRADEMGNAYIAGFTTSADFPTTPGAFQTSNRGGADNFVAKLNSSGNGLVYSTLVGGTRDEAPPAISLDESGQLWMVGTTLSLDYPTTLGAFDPSFSGGSTDAFLTVVSADGGSLTYSTFAGGGGNDTGNGIAFGPAGHVYLTGGTTSLNLPVSDDAFMATASGEQDAYLIRFAPNLGSRIYATYLGGSESDVGTDVIVDTSETAYVIGNTSSADFPTVSAESSLYNGGVSDVFLTQFSFADELPNALPQQARALAGPGAEFYPRPAPPRGPDPVPVERILPTFSRFIGTIGEDAAFRGQRFGTSIQFAGRTDQPDPNSAAVGSNCTLPGAVHIMLWRLKAGIAGVQARCLGPGIATNASLQGTDEAILTGIAEQPGLPGAVGQFGGGEDPFVAKFDYRTLDPGESDGLPVAESQGSHGTASDPVHTGAASFYTVLFDAVLGGPMPIRFTVVADDNLNEPSITGNGTMTTLDSWLEVDGDLFVFHMFPGMAIPFRRVEEPTTGSPVLLGVQIKRHNFQASFTGDGVRFYDPRDRRTYIFPMGGGRLAQITDNNGNSAVVIHGTAGPVSITYGSTGFTLDYSGSSLAALATSDGRQAKFQVDNDVLQSIIDFNGNTTTYLYDVQTGKISSIVGPDGNVKLQNERDAQGRVTSQTDGEGNVTKIERDAVSGETTVTSPDGHMTIHRYEGETNLTELRDPFDFRVRFNYDAHNNPSSVTDPEDNTTLFSFDALGNLRSTTNRRGDTYTFTYLQRETEEGIEFLPEAIIFPDGSTRSVEYDDRGNVVGRLDFSGARTSFELNARGQYTRMTGPGALDLEAEYNDGGGLTEVKQNGETILTTEVAGVKLRIDAGAILREYESDPEGNIVEYIEQEFPEDPWTAKMLWRAGGLLSEADFLEGTLPALKAEFDHDGNDRLEKVNLDNLEFGLSWTPGGRVNRFVDPAFGETTQEFDAFNRRTLFQKNDFRIGATYDPSGGILDLKSSLGQRVELKTDEENSVTEFTGPGRLHAKFDLDWRGQAQSVSGAGFGTMKLVPDRDPCEDEQPPHNPQARETRSRSRRVCRTDALGGVWRKTADPLTRTTVFTDPIDRETSVQRTKVQTTITLADGSTVTLGGSVGGVQETTASDGTSYTLEVRDNDLQGTGIDLRLDNAGRVAISNGLDISRDAAGLIESYDFGGGRTVRFVRNNGFVVLVEDWFGRITLLNRDEAGRLIGILYLNGIQVDTTFTPEGLVESITYQTPQGDFSIAYEYDDNLRRVSETRTFPNVQFPELPLAPRADNLVRNAAHQVQEFEYNGNGLVTDDGTNQFTWNALFQLASVTGETTSQVSYDAFGLPLVLMGHNVKWNYATNPPTPAILATVDAPVRFNIFLPEDGVLLYSVVAATDAAIIPLFDGDGNTLMTFDDLGQITNTCSTTPFGEIRSCRNGTQALPVYRAARGAMPVADTSSSMIFQPGSGWAYTQRNQSPVPNRNWLVSMVRKGPYRSKDSPYVPDIRLLKNALATRRLAETFACGVENPCGKRALKRNVMPEVLMKVRGALGLALPPDRVPEQWRRAARLFATVSEAARMAELISRTHPKPLKRIVNPLTVRPHLSPREMPPRQRSVDEIFLPHPDFTPYSVDPEIRAQYTKVDEHLVVFLAQTLLRGRPFIGAATLDDLPPLEPLTLSSDDEDSVFGDSILDQIKPSLVICRLHNLKIDGRPAEESDSEYELACTCENKASASTGRPHAATVPLDR